ncbi:MAG: YdcF family protein [Salibacteraceae bacterium]
MKFEINKLLFAIIAISIYTLNGCMTLNPSPTIIKSFRQGPYDAIFVPGCPYMKPEYESLLVSRVYWSKYIWEQGMTDRILYSGAAVYTPFVESKIMREIAICAGVDSNIIRIETKAQHSSENLFYCHQMAIDSGWKNVALATDVFQMSVLQKYIDAMDYDIKLLPLDFGQLGMTEKFDISIDPRKAYVENFIPITDTLTKDQIKANSKGLRVFGNIDLTKNHKSKHLSD